MVEINESRMIKYWVTEVGILTWPLPPPHTEIYYTIFSTLFNFDIFHNENITFFKTL